MKFSEKIISLSLVLVLMLSFSVICFAEPEGETGTSTVIDNQGETSTEATQGPEENDIQQTTKNSSSSNATLSSLKISGVAADGSKYEIALNPQFDSRTYSYSISVPNIIERLEITAVASDNNAKVSVPEKYLTIDVGSNNVSYVNVTAQNGAKRQYKISTLRSDETTTIAETTTVLETVTATEVFVPVTEAPTTEDVTQNDSSMNMYTKLGIVFTVGAVVFILMGVIVLVKGKRNSEGE